MSVDYVPLSEGHSVVAVNRVVDGKPEERIRMDTYVRMLKASRKKAGANGLKPLKKLLREHLKQNPEYGKALWLTDAGEGALHITDGSYVLKTLSHDGLKNAVHENMKLAGVISYRQILLQTQAHWAEDKGEGDATEGAVTVEYRAVGDGMKVKAVQRLVDGKPVQELRVRKYLKLLESASKNGEAEGLRPLKYLLREYLKRAPEYGKRLRITQVPNGGVQVTDGKYGLKHYSQEELQSHIDKDDLFAEVIPFKQIVKQTEEHGGPSGADIIDADFFAETFTALQEAKVARASRFAAPIPKATPDAPKGDFTADDLRAVVKGGDLIEAALQVIGERKGQAAPKPAKKRTRYDVVPGSAAKSGFSPLHFLNAHPIATLTTAGTIIVASALFCAYMILSEPLVKYEVNFQNSAAVAEAINRYNAALDAAPLLAKDDPEGVAEMFEDAKSFVAKAERSSLRPLQHRDLLALRARLADAEKLFQSP